MSVSSVDSNYSLMAQYSFLPVQQVRSVGPEEVPFTMGVELEENPTEETKSSLATSTSNKNADTLASALSAPFFRTSQTSNDTTGIDISPEMQNFLAQLPDAQKTQLATMQADRTSMGNAYQEGNYRANVENAQRKVAEGNKQAEPLINNVGLLTSQNPISLSENGTNAVQAQNNAINYNAPQVEAAAVQSTSLSENATFANLAQNQNASTLSTNSFLSKAFTQNDSVNTTVQSTSQASARRMNQAIKAYAGLY